MPKKAPSNGFYYFMLEMKSRNPGKYPNLAAVQADGEAGRLWEKMSVEQKQPYQNKAKEVKGKGGDVKYTSQGVRIDLVDKRATEAANLETKIKTDTKKILEVLKSTETAHKHLFHLIHVNYLMYRETDKKYYPAEIAVCEFSLENGVETTYHKIVNPGPLPMGYSYLAKITSEGSHQLSVPTGDDNLDEVWTDLIDFLTQSKTKALPIVYASKRNLEIVRNVLNNLALDFGYKENYIHVCTMEYLLFCLKNLDEELWPTQSMAEHILEKDSYDFTRNISCDIHENTDVTKYCSKSFVIRMSYIFCENVCGLLNVPLVPGKHVPRNAVVPAYKPVLEEKSSNGRENWRAPKVVPPCHRVEDDDDDTGSEMACSLSYNSNPANRSGARNLNTQQETMRNDLEDILDKTASVLSFRSTSSYQTAMDGTTATLFPTSEEGWSQVRGRNEEKKTKRQYSDYKPTAKGRGRGFMQQ